MSRHSFARVVGVALVFLAVPAAADPLVIDLATALARARTHAPQAIAALARGQQTDALLIGAQLRFMQNPELEIGVGARWAQQRSSALAARLGQRFEPRRRAAEILLAEAESRYGGAATAAQLHALDLEVTTAFNRARYADLVVESARRSLELATRTADAVQRRRKAGELTDLDVALSTVALGRAAAAVAAGQAERAETVGQLAVLLATSADAEISLRGDLRPVELPAAPVQTANVPPRPEVRVLEAEAAVAAAQRGLANAQAIPQLGLWLDYQRDEGADVALAGISVSLPLWNRGQGDHAMARARQERVAAEHKAVVGAVARQRVDAMQAYLRWRDAVVQFETEVLPAIAQGEALLERSMASGQIAMSGYLVAQQELWTAHREYLDRLLALAQAAAMLRFAGGGPQ